MSAPYQVCVVDCAMGNLRSVSRALERAGAKVEITADPERVAAADRVVFPGQGEFGKCVAALSGGLGDAIKTYLKTGRPYLGICLGMQILLEESDEAVGAEGLGVCPGRVVRFAQDLRDRAGERLKVPHMGWNQVHTDHEAMSSDRWFYFVHSYCCEPSDPSWIAGLTEHGHPFCSVLARDNVLACQFHPEKSQAAGAALLRRFLETT